MEEKQARNLELYEKRLKGVTYRQLSTDYGISQDRVYRLILKMKLKADKTL